MKSPKQEFVWEALDSLGLPLIDVRMGYPGSDGHSIPDAGCELVEALVGHVSGVIVPKKCLN